MSDGIIWYFAYGSNMQSATLRGRRGVAPRSAVPAGLAGWRLVLDKPTIIATGQSVANVVPDATAEVLGVLYEVTAEDWAHLELTEGVGFGNYQTADVSVVPLGASEAIVARTFTSPRRDPALRPSRRYLELVIAGAEEHGLPPEWIAALRAIPAGEESTETEQLWRAVDEALQTRMVAGHAVVIRHATIEEILPLRHRELRPGRPIESAHFDGDDDPGTCHLGVFQAAYGEVLGCASFIPEDWQGEPAYRLRGMATRADVARSGIGSALVRRADVLLPDRLRGGLRWCHARVEAVSFYERHGWRVVSPRFEMPDVGPHHTMVWRRSVE